MAVIDLTSRIIQPSTHPPPSQLRWHPWRRMLQVLCGVALVLLPLTNGMRADVRARVFYFAWHKMAANDVMLLFWISMMATWALVAVSFLHGRLWCGWVCPQTLASDFADSLKKRFDKAFRARPGKPAFIVSRAVWSAVLLAMSVAAGAILACYWLAPGAVGYATFHPAGDFAAALTVYSIAAVVAADMLWVRRKFCSAICPYGPLIGVLADKNTLAVRYLDERDDDCIRCGKCVTDCPMDIDIKQGVGQFACIGCGECVDACNDVLGKRGIPGLIEYRYGIEPDRHTKSLTWLQRLGIWDNRRWGVVVALCAFVAVVAVAMFGSTPLTANATANGAIVKSAGQITNSYTLMVANGSPDTQTYQLILNGLSQARIVKPTDSISVAGHSQISVPLTLAAPANALKPESGVQVDVTVASPSERVHVPVIFYDPR